MPVWIVQGAYKKDGRDVRERMEGPDEAAIRQWAKGEGILISEIAEEKPASTPELKPEKKEKPAEKKPSWWTLSPPPKPVPIQPQMPALPPELEQIRLLRSIERSLKTIEGWVLLAGIVGIIVLALVAIAFLYGLANGGSTHT